MNLSQDDINAMMGGSAVDSMTEAGSENAVPDIDISDIENIMKAADATDSEGLTQVEGDVETVDYAELQRQPDGSIARDGYSLSSAEIDTLGEIGNICMGAVATTMYTLLDRRVEITTPRVSLHTTAEVLSMYSVPFVVVDVEYIEGLDGKNILLLKEPDAALITDLLMGGDGHVEEPIELNELHMSAISEIMNQMIGASATAMSNIINKPVNISTPVSSRVDMYTDVNSVLDATMMVIKISFDMEIEGLLKSQLLQLIPYEAGLSLAEKLTESFVLDQGKEKIAAPAVQEAPPPVAPAAPLPTAPVAAPPVAMSSPPPAYAPESFNPAMTQPLGYAPAPGSLVDVRPMQYPSFDGGTVNAPSAGMGLVYDIPLQVSVELGKTKKQISEILDFGIGTVVVLEKLAGEHVEVIVNGKLIARGEVVVIEENYGVRITEIINAGQ